MKMEIENMSYTYKDKLTSDKDDSIVRLICAIKAPNKKGTLHVKRVLYTI